MERVIWNGLDLVNYKLRSSYCSVWERRQGCMAMWLSVISLQIVINRSQSRESVQLTGQAETENR